jgi:signal transduction histidine kinase
VRLTVNCANAPVLVLADLESLRAAILNLATNAIEAAGSGGQVTMTIARAATAAIVEIADTGRGPPVSVADSLFDPFITTKPEGVGLGLALARQVALDHKGSISWRREGGRTVFRLELPAVPQLAGDNSEPRIPNSELNLALDSAVPHR